MRQPRPAESPAPIQVGFGLRACHYDAILSGGVRIDWTEAISENFIGRGGRAYAVLERARKDAPIALHGVSLSIGGLDPWPDGYLNGLRDLAERVEAALDDASAVIPVSARYAA